MASGGATFPPQKQHQQPGKEHVMEPTPQSMQEDYKPADKLQGKVALVSGGDSGIGRAVCYLFPMEGATVAFTYVKSQEDKDAGETLEMLRKLKKNKDAKNPIAIPVDLGYEENCKKVAQAAAKEFGRIHILVNNAAEQYERQSIGEITEESLERIFRSNLFS